MCAHFCYEMAHCGIFSSVLLDLWDESKPRVVMIVIKATSDDTSDDTLFTDDIYRYVVVSGPQYVLFSTPIQPSIYSSIPWDYRTFGKLLKPTSVTVSVDVVVCQHQHECDNLFKDYIIFRFCVRHAATKHIWRRHGIQTLSLLQAYCEGTPATSGFTSQRVCNILLSFSFVITLLTVMCQSDNVLVQLSSLAPCQCTSMDVRNMAGIYLFIWTRGLCCTE